MRKGPRPAKLGPNRETWRTDKIILPDSLSTATLRIRTLSESLAVAVDDDDLAGALSLTTSIRACCDGLARDLVADVFDLRPDHDLRAKLFDVRQRRQHLLGSPRDFAALSFEESRLVAELQGVR